MHFKETVCGCNTGIITFEDKIQYNTKYRHFMEVLLSSSEVNPDVGIPGPGIFRLFLT